MVRRARTIAAGLALALGLAGCGKDEAEGPVGADTEAAVAESGEATAGGAEASEDAEPDAAGAGRFAAVAFAHGRPRGVGPLSALEALGRRHATVARSDGGITEVRLMGPRRRAIRSWRVERLGDDRYRVDFRDARGRLEEVHVVTDGGRSVDRRTGSGERVEARCASFRRELDEGGRTLAERCLGDDGSPREDGQGIHERRFEVNAAGFVVRERAFDAYDEPVSLGEGRAHTDLVRAVYERRYERNESGQAVKTSVFDRAGRPTEDPRGVHRVARSFDEGGRPTHRVRYRADGTRIGGPDGVAEKRWIYEGGDLREIGLLGVDGKETAAPGGFTRILFEVDDEGRPTRKAWADREGRPLVHEDLGVAAVSRRYDARGRLDEEMHLDAEGQPSLLAGRGWAGKRYRYDEAGRLTEELRLGPDREPATVEAAGWAARKTVYDPDGRLAEVRYEGPTGDLVSGPEGWAVRRVERGQPGEGPGSERIVEETLGPERRPTRGQGVGWARRVTWHDEAGRVVAEAWFDAGGEPTVEEEGRVHRVAYGYDEAGDRVAISWFGPDGEPALHAEVGAAGVRLRYDGHGREIGRELVDGGGDRTRGAGGWAIRERELDERGRLVDERYLVAPEEPVGRAEDGVAREHRFYGVGDRWRQRSFFDARVEPLHLRPGAWAREVRELDDREQVVAIVWQDGAREPANRDDLGYARVDRELDERGRMVAERYRDETGSPAMRADEGHAGVRWKLDAQGRVEREVFLGRGGEPGITPDGFAQRELAHHGDRWTVRGESFLGPKGRPAFHEDGYAGLEREVDARGRTTRVRYLDALGNPVPSRTGAAEERWSYEGDHLLAHRTLGPEGEFVRAHDGTVGFDRRYDGLGRVVEESAVGPDGLPAKDPRTGCVSRRFEHESTGEVKREACLGATSQPTVGAGGWAVRETSRDSRGRVTGITLRGADGALKEGPDGWARELRVWDQRGFIAGKAWVGADGEPAELDGRYAAVDYDVDALGRRVEERWLDAAGEPTIRADGYAGRRWRYDPWGRVVEEAWLDPEGAPARRGARAIESTRYDEAGHVVERRHLDAAGDPTIGPDGWAIVRLERGPRGRVVRRRYFLDDERPGRRGASYDAVRLVRDRFGRVRERRTEDAEGRPVDQQDDDGHAWALAKTGYDRAGRKKEESWFDAGGRPVVGPEGVHRIRYAWTEHGRLDWQQRYLSPSRAAEGGWARQSYVYDSYGRLTRIEYQDEMGRPAIVWGAVGEIRLTYRDDGRLARMTYHGPGGDPVDARVCYPGKWCGEKAVHEVRYQYAHGRDEPGGMTLHTRAGVRRARLDCGDGRCF